MITVVDYGMGNLFSVVNALERLALAWRLTSDPAEVAASDRLILPGVGSFREAMLQLNNSGLTEAILENVAAGRPLLGICLGMQLLAEFGTEDAEPGSAVPGLGLIRGTVRALPSSANLKVPHIGFNEVWFQREHSIFKGVQDGSDFYFVHSFHFDAHSNSVIAKTPYGAAFTSVVSEGVVMGTQFHPEKSQANGLRLLRNYSLI